MVHDAEGVDLYPLAEAAAIANGVPIELLLALCQAESDLVPNAQRFGARTEEAQQLRTTGNYDELQHLIDDVWPDVSGGLTQMTVATAHSLGLGNGSADADDVLGTLDTLAEREIALDLGARLLSQHLADPAVQDSPDPDLAALVSYNAGYLPPTGNPWWQTWAANVNRYSQALAWAKDLKT